jgi:hypothetical protein
MCAAVSTILLAPQLTGLQISPGPRKSGAIERGGWSCVHSLSGRKMLRDWPSEKIESNPIRTGD